MRARRRLSDRKRDRIIDAGRSVFLADGFGDATMDAIAAEAKVSKMTVYRHFRNKELLFAGVISELCRRIVDDDLESLLALAPPQALRSFADRVVAIIFARETIELHRIVVAESRRFPKLGRLFYRSGPQACIEMLEQYLRRHRPRAWSNGDARRHAEEFLDLIRGYPHLRLLLGVAERPSRRELQARIDSAIRNLLTAMRS
jgi:TetR/AcrR family transcriptional repressor of mexJK operon